MRIRIGRLIENGLVSRTFKVLVAVDGYRLSIPLGIGRILKNE